MSTILGIADLQQGIYPEGMEKERLAWEKLRPLRESKGLSLDDLAAYAERDRGWLSRIERGQFKREPSHWIVGALAKGLDVEPSTLLVTMEANPEDEGVIRPWYETASDEELMERVGVQIAPPYMAAVASMVEELSLHAGEEGSPILQDIEDSFPQLIKAERKKGDPTRWFRIFGTCMEPKISDGDWVFIDRDLPIESGKFVAAIINGEQAVARKIVRKNERLWLETLDGQPPILVSDGVRIIGRIKHRQSSFA